MITVIGFPSFNVTKVLMTLEELEQDFKFQQITADDSKSAEHIKHHPLGKVPVILHNGHSLFESNSICRYLACLNDDALYSKDIYKRAVIDQWIDMITQHAGRWATSLYVQEFIKPSILDLPPDQSAIEEAEGLLEVQLPVLDRQLKNNQYLAGNQLTIADIIAFCNFSVSEKCRLDLSPFTYLKQWYDALKQRPSYTKALAHYRVE